jgi:hypothetical protein
MLLRHIHPHYATMIRARTTTAAFLALALGVLGACGDTSGPSVGPPSSLARTLGDNQTGAAGEELPTPLTVRVSDAQGNVIPGATVTFAVEAGGGSVSAAQVQTSAEGLSQTTWTLGREAGAEQRVAATVLKGDGTSAATTFRATATAGAPAVLVKISGDGQRGGTGSALADTLVVRVTDRFGNGVPWTSVTWSSVANGRASPAISGTDEGGFARTAWILGDNLGPARIEAVAGTLPPASFSADAVMGILSIQPAIIENGSTVVITGVGFSAAAAANTVSIGGVSLTVTEASDTRVSAVLPSRPPCIPSGNSVVSLRSAEYRSARSHPVALAPIRSFVTGDALVGTPDDLLQCVGLPTGGSRYLIAVSNTNGSPVSSQGFRLRATGGPAQAPSAGALAQEAPLQLPGPRLSAEQARQLQRFAERHARHTHVHDAMLRDNVRLLEATRPTPDQLAAQRLRALQAGAQTVPSIGDTLAMKVPQTGVGATTCATIQFDEVRARVAYVGERAIVLEDVANPVTNSLDPMYRQIGQEFDAQQYPVVRDNFGDPLVLDGMLDNNGRLFMLFTQKVDGSRIAGFVYSGDLTCPQLNGGEIFYGYAPKNANPEYGEETAGEWFWSIRSTVIHEVKHIASFAARLSSNATSWEDLWIEEGSAMAAEEIWARQVFSYGQNANVGYMASVGCEIRGAFNLAPCEGKPGVMFLHFLQLRHYLGAPEARSPLGSAAANDASFYGSGWLFLRWLAENSGMTEREFFTQLTQTRDWGATNIERRIGRPFADLVAEWSMALALDDRPDVAPSNARFRINSWNVRDVYRGLNIEQPQIIPTPYPFAPTPLGFGTSTTDVQTVRGGGTKFFELSGTPQAQTLEFLGLSGGDLPGSMRVTIFRIE